MILVTYKFDVHPVLTSGLELVTDARETADPGGGEWFWENRGPPGLRRSGGARRDQATARPGALHLMTMERLSQAVFEPR